MTRFRDRETPAGRALVMAIVNRAKDAPDTALPEVDQAVADGADIIDIGAGDAVDVDEEIQRMVPFVAAVRERHPGVVVAVDTGRHEVGKQVCAVGANLINDTRAGADPRLGEVVAEYGAGIVCSSAGRHHYADVVAEVAAELVAAAERMVAIGVPAGGVLIDPTPAFGADASYGLALLRRLDELVATGWPVLMTLSGNDFVGKTLGEGLAARTDGTLAATAVAAARGARVFRAHDVRQTRQVVDMVASIAGTRLPADVARGLA